MSLGKIKRRLYLGVSAYFRWWANIAFRRWKPRVIAVTGSVGKTTMLHLLEVQLGDQAHYSHHANSIYGISFDLVGLSGVDGSKWRWLWLVLAVPLRALVTKRTEEFYVVEIDADRPNEARIIANWLEPEVTLWVSVGHSHAYNFETMVARGDFSTVEDAIAYEFAAVALATKKLVVIDARSQAMKQNVQDCEAKTVKVNPEIKSYHIEASHTVIETESHRYSLPYPLQRDIATQLAMLEALCKYLNMDVADDWYSLTTAPGRNSYFKGINDTNIIDSSYNAHLISMRSMIAMFDEIQADKKWLVLGDMVEQGKDAGREHKLLGEVVADTSSIERVVLVGRRTGEYTEPAIKAHSKDMAVVQFDKPQDALAYIKNELSGGETLLFKGSQYLEWIIEKLLVDQSDIGKLARQDPAAKQRRRNWGLL